MILKSFAIAAVLASLAISLPVHAQVSAREALVERVSALYRADQEFDAESPLLQQTFQLVRESNEGVPEQQWRAVRRELAAALHGMYTRQGGVFDALIRGTVVDLSDTELERLAQLMADPVYRKFHRLMTSRQGQERMFEMMVKVMLASFGEINEVLRRHGLKEIH